MLKNFFVQISIHEVEHDRFSNSSQLFFLNIFVFQTQQQQLNIIMSRQSLFGSVSRNSMLKSLIEKKTKQKQQYQKQNPTVIKNSNQYAVSQLAYNPFDMKLVQQTKDSFGDQIKTKNIYGGKITEGSINYSKGIEMNLLSSSANSFLHAYGGQNQKYRQFKGILKQKITNGKNAVQNYSLTQISQFLPWVFSPVFLFEPFRTVLYCKYNHIQIQTLTEHLNGKIPQQMLNNGAMMAIYLSLKGMPYLQQSIEFFKKKNVATGNFIKKILANTTQTLSNIVSGFADAVKLVASTSIQLLKKAMGQQINGQTDPDGITKFTAAIALLLDQMFSPGHIMSYGNIIINYVYLVKYGLSQTIGNARYYYFPDQSQLVFTLIQSKLIVLKSQNGILSTIPQSQFNQQYLKKIVKTRVIQSSADIFSSLKKVTSQKLSKQQPMNNFNQQYLSTLPILQNQYSISTNSINNRKIYDATKKANQKKAKALFP